MPQVRAWHHWRMGVSARRPGPDADELADAILTASRNVVQATAAALVELAPDLNLTDFRVLALLEERGALRLTDIAEALQVTGTTATRLADRLGGQKMVSRVRQSDNRREIHLAIAEPGRSLLATVYDRRREFVAACLGDVTRGDRSTALRVLEQLAAGPAVTGRETA